MDQWLINLTGQRGGAMKHETNLRQIRKDRGLSIAKLADMCGSYAANLYNLEVGKALPNLATAYTIAKVLDLTVYDIWPDNTEVVEEKITIRRVAK